MALVQKFCAEKQRAGLLLESQRQQDGGRVLYISISIHLYLCISLSPHIYSFLFLQTCCCGTSPRQTLWDGKHENKACACIHSQVFSCVYATTNISHIKTLCKGQPVHRAYCEDQLWRLSLKCYWQSVATCSYSVLWKMDHQTYMNCFAVASLCSLITACSWIGLGKYCTQRTHQARVHLALISMSWTWWMV